MKNENEFYETPTDSHKKAVMNAVRSELQKNKDSVPSRYALFSWQTAAVTAFASLFVYFQLNKPLQIDEMNSNLITELASLKPLEREVIEELEFVEFLDQMSEQEIKEITL